MASRVQKINLKQITRIREVGEQEKKEREAKTQKVNQLIGGPFKNSVLSDEINKETDTATGDYGLNKFPPTVYTPRNQG